MKSFAKIALPADTGTEYNWTLADVAFGPTAESRIERNKKLRERYHQSQAERKRNYRKHG